MIVIDKISEIIVKINQEWSYFTNLKQATKLK
jgi:hypothetical protein